MHAPQPQRRLLGLISRNAADWVCLTNATTPSPRGRTNPLSRRVPGLAMRGRQGFNPFSPNEWCVSCLFVRFFLKVVYLISFVGIIIFTLSRGFYKDEDQLATRKMLPKHMLPAQLSRCPNMWNMRRDDRERIRMFENNYGWSLWLVFFRLNPFK